MNLLVYFFVFVFGTAIGSFLNVVSFRLGTEMPIVSGKSKCFSCEKGLQWFELIPVLSFIFLKGKCGNCGRKISWQYPAIEIITGLIFTGVFWKLGVLDFAYQSNFPLAFSIFSLLVFWAIWSILVVIAVYDFRHKIVPDSLVFLFSGLALLIFLVGHLTQGLPLSGQFWMDLAAGPILFTPFFLIWFFSGGRVMGLGDGKLALGMGFLLGLSGGFSAIVLAFWIGAIISLSIILAEKIIQLLGFKSGDQELTMKSQVPFAPFLVLGTAIVFFTETDVLGISLIFGF